VGRLAVLEALGRGFGNTLNASPPGDVRVSGANTRSRVFRARHGRALVSHQLSQGSSTHSTHSHTRIRVCSNLSRHGRFPGGLGGVQVLRQVLHAVVAPRLHSAAFSPVLAYHGVKVEHEALAFVQHRFTRMQALVHIKLDLVATFDANPQVGRPRKTHRRVETHTPGGSGRARVQSASQHLPGR
jgi:hypothetical protein